MGIGKTEYGRRRLRRRTAVSEWWFEVEVVSQPRDLTRLERDSLNFMLSGEQEWVKQLREQASNARVVGMCPCGCPTIDLEVERTDEHRAPVGSGVILESRTDTDPPFELLIFADDGWLSSLELVHYVGDAPK